MEQDDPLPEQALGELSMLSMADHEEGGYTDTSVQQVLEHNCALRRNFENVCLSNFEKLHCV